MQSLKRQILIITVICAAIMELIDTSIVNVALSHMSGNLGATLEDTSWVITSYAIANVIVIPITSFLTAKLGRRNYYIGSVILFTACSFFCGNATNIWELVFFRFLQGIGGGSLLSVSQTVMFEQFPREKQSIASAMFGVGVFVGPTIGPTLGGWITEYYSWPWIFYVNIPLGIAVTISCYWLLQEPKERMIIKKIDWTGIALLIVGVSTLQTVLERGETEDWFATGYITAFTIIAIIALTAFVLWELRVQTPVVNLRVLKSRSLAVAAVLTFVTGMGLFTSVFLTPVFAQRLLNFTPTETGLLLLPGAIIAILALILSGQALQKGVPPIVIITTGYLLFIFFSWKMYQIDLDITATQLSVYLIFRALGIALLTVPLTMLAVSSLEPKDMPQGASLNNMMRQLGGSFGISIVNTYIARRMASHRLDLVSHVTPDNPITAQRLAAYTQRFEQAGATTALARQKAIALLDQVVIKQSATLSYLDAYLFIGMIFVLALPLLLLVIGRRPAKKMPAPILADH
ncbi:DHA2 family efflux MFS transporter permease subunit [Chitinophaga pendula]|uniref:DHA2 family efflux MFS transporter permease subunit n=1 Tax=Chitinophaga TaxID=79328 RepID=UPI000BB07889|nr:MULTISPECIES: DHA2 family efflux MFS transporter permease subunit [Chitinophaga]ASZ14959.1 MFS transporter [Chitinophaga sp. MD30]UCJ04744.1 DHA2 family efflux MFS transporter permease subunit [Chitinophaga pendula]